MRLTREMGTFSFVGVDDQMLKMIELAKEVGGDLKVSLRQASFENGDLLSVLTEKQRSLMVMAKEMGYYEYPRRTSTEDLAKAAGLSTSTVIEHLRKSEVRLMAEIMAGQR
jgi:predicted DNA binding protein